MYENLPGVWVGTHMSMYDKLTRYYLHGTGWLSADMFVDYDKRIVSYIVSLQIVGGHWLPLVTRSFGTELSQEGKQVEIINVMRGIVKIITASGDKLLKKLALSENIERLMTNLDVKAEVAPNLVLKLELKEYVASNKRIYWKWGVYVYDKTPGIDEDKRKQLVDGAQDSLDEWRLGFHSICSFREEAFKNGALAVQNSMSKADCDLERSLNLINQFYKARKK
jgi:hypothetical protein